MPTIPVLKRILAVLDEELLIDIERRRVGASRSRVLLEGVQQDDQGP